MRPFTHTGLFAPQEQEPAPVICGLDLGKNQDFSALIPLRKTGVRKPLDDSGRALTEYSVTAVIVGKGLLELPKRHIGWKGDDVPVFPKSVNTLAVTWSWTRQGAAFP